MCGVFEFLKKNNFELREGDKLTVQYTQINIMGINYD